jgi:hypothetical protein
MLTLISEEDRVPRRETWDSVIEFYARRVGGYVTYVELRHLLGNGCQWIYEIHSQILRMCGQNANPHGPFSSAYDSAAFASSVQSC